MPPLAPKAGHFALILPLATTSATLGLALFQYPLFNAFLTPPTTNTSSTQTTIAGAPLSHFWTHFLPAGASLIAGLATLSTTVGLGTARWLRTHRTLETTDVSSWYIWGSVFAAAHLAFVPLVAGPIGRIMGRGEDGEGLTVAGTAVHGAEGEVEGERERRNREAMKRWFVVHTLRTVFVDLAAVVCFAEGIALSFWVTH